MRNFVWQLEEKNQTNQNQRRAVSAALSYFQMLKEGCPRQLLPRRPAKHGDTLSDPLPGRPHSDDSQGLIGRRCRPATSSLLFSRRSLHLFTFFHSLFSSPHPFIISLVIARFHATFSQTSYSSSIHQTSLHLHVSPLPSFSSVHLSFLRAVSYNQAALC